MTHPTQEELVTLLYGETDAMQRLEVEQHLKTCAGCRALLHDYRTSMADLDAWPLPRRRKPRRMPWSALAAAAAITALAAVGGIRLWTLESQVHELRGELARKAADSSVAALREEIFQIGAENERIRASDRDAFAAALQRSQVNAAANYATLRKELETVAILTEAGFQNAQSEIAQLANTPRDNSSTQ